MMKSKFLAPVLFLLLFMALLPACSKQKPVKNKTAQIAKVTVAQPKVERIERIISAVGSLEPEDQVQLTTEVSGIISEIKFEEGQELNQGDAMAILDPASFKLNVENSQALLERAKTNLALADANYKRKKDLYEKKFITEQELQELTNALDKAKAEYTSALVACDIAQKALQDSVIKAPFDVNNKNYTWAVQQKMISIGEFISPGKPIAELVNRTTLKLRFTVPEQDALHLTMDKPVKFTVPALPNREFDAKIFYISPSAVENIRSVIIKARLNNTERLLRPGYSANVRLIAEIKEKAIVIPRRSLRYDVNKSYVLVVNSGVLNRKTVTLGVEKEDYVEIVAGINPTDLIVVRSSSFLDDGSEVEIVEDAPIGGTAPKDTSTNERK
ncbi:MAG: efflux RND transporter periplasmic adaptor subunit [Planctomycetota bacterium]